MVFVLFLVVTLFKMLWLTFLYFGTRIAIRKFNKEKLTKEDFKNDTYYREILPKYSPAVLSYIDDFKIRKEDIAATLLVLELKGKIKKENEKIEILNYSTEDLAENEKNILKNLNENRLKKVDLLHYNNIVQKDALKCNLIKEKEEVEKNTRLKIVKTIVVYAFVLLSFFVLVPNLIEGRPGNSVIVHFGLIFEMVAFIAIIGTPFSFRVYIETYKTLNTIDPYVRSKEGEEINKKIEGLRKFLNEYSQIEGRSQEELVLWEDYLVYSVILGINTKVVEEIFEKIY